MRYKKNKEYYYYKALTVTHDGVARGRLSAAPVEFTCPLVAELVSRLPPVATSLCTRRPPAPACQRTRQR